MSIMQTQDISKYICVNFFNNNGCILKIIQEYAPKDFAVNLIDRIAKNDHEASNEIVCYILRNIVHIPSLKTCTLSNVFETRKVCTFIMTQSTLFRRGEKIFGFTLVAIASHCLHQLNIFHPVNDVDPITIEEIQPNDSFTTRAGQKFSVSALVDYHNTRQYRGDKGEQFGQRYLLNPLTNSIFSRKDSSDFICQIVYEHPDKELLYLHSTAWGSPSDLQKDDTEATSRSPREWYDWLKEFRQCEES